MSGSPQPNNPLDIAQKSWDMRKQSPDDKAFKWMALAMMGLAGFCATLHAVHMLVKDTRDGRRERDREKERSDRRPPASASPPADADTYEEPSRDGKKWSHRPELVERQPQGDHAQAAHSRSHAVRQH
jgi:hypothetical protein